MRKRLWPVLLAACLLLCLLPLRGRGAADTSSLIFTVMDNRLMTVVRVSEDYVEPDKLSFFSNGTYYVYAGYFESLSVINKVNHNAERQTVTVYNMSQSLFFDYSNGITMDKAGTYYDYGAIWRGGNIFLPLSVVAQGFGLYYQHVSPTTGTDPIPAPILYIASEKPTAIAPADWGHRTSQRLVSIRKRYIAELEAVEQLPDPPLSTTDPQQPPKLVYLSFEGALSPELTPAILQALEESIQGLAVKATFFIPADRESILASADLLRRLYAEGYPIGLALPAGEAALEALETGNALLSKVVFAKTRLVCLEGGTQGADPALLDALVQAGCRLWDANISPDLSGETSARNVSTALRSSLSRGGGTAVIGLSATDTCLEILPALLTYIDSGNFSLLTATPWDTPVNQAQILMKSSSGAPRGAFAAPGAPSGSRGL